MVCCACGLEAVIRTSWTNRNPGRRFYSCPTLSSTCANFLWWFDPLMCQRSVQIIPRLLRSRNELEEIPAMVEEKRRNIDERRLFIRELEQRLPTKVMAYKAMEELKGLQKDDMIKAMEMSTIALQLHLQAMKGFDFYKSL
uniref:Zinc finger, GRF-type n=1 Tax=Tanacetum cinerariifolium TaxID=118510 RepID=A0A6L2KZB1_TANCI|nr:zinc finger, GRF-type [Tanacetum cinerariifolium]